MLGQRPMTILAHAERHMDPGTTCERLDLCQQLSGNWEHRIHTPLVHGGSTTSEYPPMQGHQCKLVHTYVHTCLQVQYTMCLYVNSQVQISCSNIYRSLGTEIREAGISSLQVAIVTHSTSLVMTGNGVCNLNSLLPRKYSRPLKRLQAQSRLVNELSQTSLAWV